MQRTALVWVAAFIWLACSEGPTSRLPEPAAPPAEAPPPAGFAEAQEAAAAFDAWRVGGAPVAEGVERAKARRRALSGLMLADPQAALALALPPQAREALPAEVRVHLERWVEGVGKLHVLCVTPADPSEPPLIEKLVELDGRLYRAGLYGRAAALPTVERFSIRGIELDGTMALEDDPAEPGGPLADLMGDSSWTEGAKTVLFVRVDFSDMAGDPVTQAAAQTLIDTTVNQFFDRASYGKTSLSATVTPTFRMTKTKADYLATNNYVGLMSDSKVAARAAGFEPNDFNLYIVGFKQMFSGGWAGRAYIGSKGMWLNGYFDLRVAGHETGHNYGLSHANLWQASGDSIIGAGTSLEYGNPFDMMGNAGGANSHFNGWFKKLLNWVTPAEVTTVTAAGTYRVHALEPLTTGGARALRVPRGDNAKDYWVEFRQALSNPSLQSGASLNWGYASSTGSHLLDTTVGGTSSDSALVIGRTFSDLNAGIHLTPVGKGGTTPESLDVVVNFGPFPGNQAPALSLAASAAAVATGAPVTFTATASDPDGDTLAYDWSFGDGSFGTNSASATKSWSAAKAYAVRCTVSDMKGGLTSAAVLVTVGAPVNFVLSGTVSAADGGAGIGGVRVTSGTRTTFTASDGVYALTDVPAGSYTLSAVRTGYTFTRGFAAPLAVDGGTFGLDFSAHPVAGYKISGKVTAGSTAVAGVRVTDGTRVATTNASGDYSLAGVPNGLFTLVASKPGWAFSASGVSPIEVLGGDVTGKNFLASGTAIGGTISGVPTAPVVTDGLRTATTYSAGANSWGYSISGVPPGQWTVSARLSGYVITPTFSNPVTVGSSAVSGRNFTAVAGTAFAVSGNVTTGATPLPGVVVSTGTVSATSDPAGNFLLPNLTAGSYTLTASRAGYSFVPATRPVTVAAADVAGQDFTTTTVNLPPTIAVAAAAAQGSPGAATAQLSVLGDDDQGEANLTYTWSHNQGTFLPPGFGANGTNAAKTTTVTFQRAGSYRFNVVILDAGGLSVTAQVNVTVQAQLQGLKVTPLGANVMINTTQPFSATGVDQFNQNLFAGPYAWSVSGGGVIATSGVFTAGATAGGPHTVTVAAAGKSATANVTVVSTGAPGITTGAAASPSPVTGLTTTLTVQATDDQGEPALVYTWSASVSPGNVAFAPNGSNAAKTSVATFEEAGDYQLVVTVQDAGGNTASSTVSVKVLATPTALAISPATVALVVNDKALFTAQVLDQFGMVVAPPPPVSWSASGGGAIDAAGELTAGAAPGGPFTVGATSGSASGSASFTVIDAPDTQPPTVALTAPEDNGGSAGPVHLEASATDNVAVTELSLLADGAVLATFAAPPYQLDTTLGPGVHQLLARARDAAGNSAESQPVTFTVTTPPPDLTAPTVSVTSPEEGALVEGWFDVLVQAEDDVAVVRVQLELDGAAAGELSAGPWTFPLDASVLGEGPHSLVAIAEDGAGNQARSVEAGFIVGAPSEQAAPALEAVRGGCGGCSAGGLELWGLLGAALVLARPRRRFVA